MDFASPISLEPIAEGWYHRTFSRQDPMEISFVEQEGRNAVRLATDGSASMLFRFVDVPLDDYPFLEWEWFVEQPIETTFDERTPDGDDHPARLYLKFLDAEGEERAMELIWGNQHLEAGDWLRLEFLWGLIEFPHYTVNGGPAAAGRWHAERIDMRALFAELWAEAGGARLIELALFCDTDQTGAESIAYFAQVRAARVAP